MAGRVPVGSQRTAVAREMEDTFIQNLRYAADVLSKVADVAIGVDACGSSVHWWECRGTFRRNPALKLHISFNLLLLES